MALLRRYEPPDRLGETFVAPDRLHVWRTGGGEIDFVAGPRNALEIVEVKYQNDPGLLRTNAYSLIPAWLLLWALG